MREKGERKWLVIMIDQRAEETEKISNTRPTVGNERFYKQTRWTDLCGRHVYRPLIGVPSIELPILMSFVCMYSIGFVDAVFGRGCWSSSEAIADSWFGSAFDEDSFNEGRRRGWVVSDDTNVEELDRSSEAASVNVLANGVGCVLSSSVADRADSRERFESMRSLHE